METGMLIDQNGMTWLRENHREIYRMGECVLAGTFRLKAYLAECDSRSIALVYGDATEDIRRKPGFLDDRFLIRVRFAENNSPRVEETGGRLQARADLLGIPVSDLHVNTNGTVCLGLPEIVALKIRRGSGVKDFFVNQIAPYFYYHAYCEKHGKEPWRGLSHALGLATLEQIAVDKDDPESLEVLFPLAKKRLPPNTISAKSERIRCLCGKMKKMVDCHPEAAMGHRILKEKAPPDIINARPSLRPYLRKAKSKKKGKQ